MTFFLLILVLWCASEEMWAVGLELFFPTGFYY